MRKKNEERQGKMKGLRRKETEKRKGTRKRKGEDEERKGG